MWGVRQRAFDVARSFRQLTVLHALAELTQHAIRERQAVAQRFLLARAARQATVRAEAVERFFAADQRADFDGVERGVGQEVQSGGFCAGFAAYDAQTAEFGL